MKIQVRTRPVYNPPLRHVTDRPEVSVNRDYVNELALSPRDHALLDYLAEVRYATTEQLARLCFAYTTDPPRQAARRLRQLWEIHVLDRVPGAMLLAYGLRQQLVYSLGAAGVLLIFGDEKVRYQRGTHLLAHNVLLSEAIVAAARVAPIAGWEIFFHGERKVQAAFQIESGRWVRMRPDGLLRLQRRSDMLELSFWVEMDVATEIDAYVQKLTQYEQYYKSNAWRETYKTCPSIVVIVAATGDKLAERVERAQLRLERILELVRERRREPLVWYFTTLADFGTGQWVGLDAQGNRRLAQFFRA